MFQHSNSCKTSGDCLPSKMVSCSWLTDYASPLLKASNLELVTKTQFMQRSTGANSAGADAAASAAVASGARMKDGAGAFVLDTFAIWLCVLAVCRVEASNSPE